MWPYVVKHWCFAENTHDYGGDCSYRKRYGVWSKAQRIPFGAIIDFKLPKKLEKQLPKFGPRGLPGLLLGYRTQPGGKWSGDYRVSPLCDWDSAKSTTRNVRIFSVKEVTRPRGDWRFPMRRNLDRKEREIEAAKPGVVLHDVVKPDDD